MSFDLAIIKCKHFARYLSHSFSLSALFCTPDMYGHDNSDVLCVTLFNVTRYVYNVERRTHRSTFFSSLPFSFLWIFQFNSLRLIWFWKLCYVQRITEQRIELCSTIITCPNISQFYEHCVRYIIVSYPIIYMEGTTCLFAYCTCMRYVCGISMRKG